jgi:hypothetical protein
MLLPLCSSLLIKEKDMKLNVGSTDRMVRVIAGVVLALLLLTGVISLGSTFGILAAIAAAILIITGSVSFCPAYSLIGVKTRSE